MNAVEFIKRFREGIDKAACYFPDKDVDNLVLDVLDNILAEMGYVRLDQQEYRNLKEAYAAHMLERGAAHKVVTIRLDEGGVITDVDIPDGVELDVQDLRAGIECDNCGAYTPDEKVRALIVGETYNPKTLMNDIIKLCPACYAIIDGTTIDKILAERRFDENDIPF